MSAVMTELMVRVFAGGALCAAAMILAGDGAKKEVVRLCCASLMIIFVLSPLKALPFSLPDLLGGRDAVAAQIDAALAQAGEVRADATARALADYIEELAQTLGVTCTADVVCLTGADGRTTIDSVSIVHQGGTDDTLGRLRLRIAQDCGLAADRIIMTEADIP